MISRTQKLPDKIQAELVRPVLLAFFYLGKLYREIISPSKEIQMGNLNSSIESYQVII